MAHTKQGGSTNNGRDSNPQYLGIKRQHDQRVKVGEILIRQRGTRYLPGENVKRGKDDTIYAIKNGTVKFQKTKKKLFSGNYRYATKINVIAL